MNQPISDEQVSAYLDGELTPQERAQIEQLIEQSAEHRKMLDELRALRASLQALPRYELDDQFPQRVLRRAEREMLAGAPRSAAKPADQTAQRQPAAGGAASRGSWKVAVLAVSTVAAMLLVAIAIHPALRHSEPGPVAMSGSQASRDQVAEAPPHVAQQKVSAAPAAAESKGDERRLLEAARPSWTADVGQPVAEERMETESMRPMDALQVELHPRAKAAGRGPVRAPVQIPQLQPGGQYVITVALADEATAQQALRRALARHGVSMTAQAASRPAASFRSALRTREMPASVKGGERAKLSKAPAEPVVVAVEAAADQINAACRDLYRSGQLMAMTVQRSDSWRAALGPVQAVERADKVTRATRQPAAAAPSSGVSGQMRSGKGGEVGGGFGGGKQGSSVAAMEEGQRQATAPAPTAAPAEAIAVPSARKPLRQAAPPAAPADRLSRKSLESAGGRGDMKAAEEQKEQQNQQAREKEELSAAKNKHQKRRAKDARGRSEAGRKLRGTEEKRAEATEEAAPQSGQAMVPGGRPSADRPAHAAHNDLVRVLFVIRPAPAVAPPSEREADVPAAAAPATPP